ncbi:MAG: YciI family protein [Thermomonas sp.]
MKYLGLAYFTPAKFAAMAPDDVKQLVSQCPALDEKMRATGRVLVSASLGDLEKWKTLRPRSGKTHVSDGPYTESKEVVGGLFIIEADSQEEAVRIASMHPAATLGEAGEWAVELIPMDFYLVPSEVERRPQEC